MIMTVLHQCFRPPSYLPACLAQYGFVRHVLVTSLNHSFGASSKRSPDCNLHPIGCDMSHHVTVSYYIMYIHIFIYLSRLNCTKLGKWLHDWFKSGDLVWLERFCMRICVQPQKKWPCCPYFMGYLSNGIQQIVLSSKYPSLILLTFVRTKFWNRSKREGGT